MVMKMHRTWFVPLAEERLFKWKSVAKNLIEDRSIVEFLLYYLYCIVDTWFRWGLEIQLASLVNWIFVKRWKLVSTNSQRGQLQVSVPNIMALDIVASLDLLCAPLSFHFVYFLNLQELELVITCNRGCCFGNTFSCILLLWAAHFRV